MLVRLVKERRNRFSIQKFTISECAAKNKRYLRKSTLGRIVMGNALGGDAGGAVGWIIGNAIGRAVESVANVLS